MNEFIKLADDQIEVYDAESVEHAMDQLTGDLIRFPDVIYVDLNMPVLNGFDFIELYEQEFLRDHPDSKIYMLSSSLRPEDKKKAMNYKCVKDFVSKNDIDLFLQETLIKVTT